MVEQNDRWNVSDEEFRGWAKAKIQDIEVLVRGNANKIDRLIWRVGLVTGTVSLVASAIVSLALGFYRS